MILSTPNRVIAFIKANILVLTVLMLFAIVMLWFTYEKHQTYWQYQQYLGKQSSLNARESVAMSLSSKQRFVNLSVEDNIELIRQLAKRPDDEQLFAEIVKELARYTPDLVTINIANSKGQLLIADFEGFTGELCISDLKQFIKTGQHYTRVHPNHILYHYDLVKRFTMDGEDYIFFVSFGLDDLQASLKHATPSGHGLILATIDKETIIEVTARGGRNKIPDRLDYRLTDAEKDDILNRIRIDGARWYVLDLINRKHMETHLSRLIIQNILIFALLVITLILARYMVATRIFKMNKQIRAQNSELKEQLIVDELTGLYNRRYLDTQLSKEWYRAMREHKKISVILLDVDHFKLYNDNYGHIEGDKCIRQVAAVLKLSFQRENDFVARYGGEEFCVVLNDPSAEDPLLLVKKFQKNLAAMNIRHEFSPITDHVTTSLGIATEIPGKDSIPEEILGKADKALYEAKNTGRNKFIYYNRQKK